MRLHHCFKKTCLHVLCSPRRNVCLRPSWDQLTISLSRTWSWVGGLRWNNNRPSYRVGKWDVKLISFQRFIEREKSIRRRGFREKVARCETGKRSVYQNSNSMLDFSQTGSNPDRLPHRHSGRIPTNRLISQLVISTTLSLSFVFKSGRSVSEKWQMEKSRF